MSMIQKIEIDGKQVPFKASAPFRVFTVSNSTEISTRISMRSERQSETVMKVPLTSICSLLRCLRTSPTSWQSMQIHHPGQPGGLA